MLSCLTRLSTKKALVYRTLQIYSILLFILYNEAFKFLVAIVKNSSTTSVFTICSVFSRLGRRNKECSNIRFSIRYFVWNYKSRFFPFL